MKAQTLAMFIFLTAASFKSYAENITIESGICGPAKAIHTLLQSAGYVLMDPFFVLHENKGLMSYLPSPERIINQRLKGQTSPGLERIEVVHEDASEQLPGGRRCIRHIGYMSPSEVESLTNYFNRVSPMFKGSKQN